MSDGLEEILAAFDRRQVWCHCWGTPPPSGPWLYPNDEHADTCGIDAFHASHREGEQE
jgi:hypothetical protein